MTQIIPPFVAPDDVTDEGRWMRLVGGRIVFDDHPATTLAALIDIAPIVGTAEVDAQGALEEIYTRLAALVPSVMPVRSISSASALVPATDALVLCVATAAAFSFTLTEPLAGQRNWFYVQKTDASANAVTLDPPGATLINGAATYALTTTNQSVMIVWTGTELGWRALA